ncbi:NAD(P)H-hydrate dehydratase [Limnohabitans sp. Rim8]|uniref:NAD(P)H-hydrate dehydratase n=1 Tax=Limnohabitans sp. Rim8 TaxID=1100718 RepID=UPI00261BCB09|nr:NAD(P)H-hydrate dehydratase [Limnohabitans sp. Rim8]
MQPLPRSHDWPILGPEGVRQLEPLLQALSPTPLMQRAGLACAQLALAVAPHARRIWVAAGPGNNGGDGLEAALHLHQWGKEVVVSLLAAPGHCPTDALAALHRAQQAGVRIQHDVPQAWLQTLDAHDLCIDALLGIGASRPLTPDIRARVQAINYSPAQVLSIDVPTGLHPQSGQWLGCENADTAAVQASHTLSLIALQAGLLMGHGRDASGLIWLEDLGYHASPHRVQPVAQLNAPCAPMPKHHASHKGSHGDVAVIGGEGMATHGMGMTGAAILAATAALHAGAGRVILNLLSGQTSDNAPPDLMQRQFDPLALDTLHVVCGCGGGTAVQALMPQVLQRSAHLVLDADGLNAVAHDTALQNSLRQRAKRQDRPHDTVLTPHPLEAARLLGCSTAQVQNDRIQSAQALADRYQCTVVLKGSGTVIAAPAQTPRINTSGNGRLAIGGTGDVLAGLIGARMAQGLNAFDAACAAVAQHGQLADNWPPNQALTASRLASRLT